MPELPQGYGQTECCGCAAISIPGDYRGNCIGGVVASSIMKLESVPEMGYLTENNQGTNDFQSRRHIFVLFLCSSPSYFLQ